MFTQQPGRQIRHGDIRLRLHLGDDRIAVWPEFARGLGTADEIGAVEPVALSSGKSTGHGIISLTQRITPRAKGESGGFCEVRWHDGAAGLGVGPHCKPD
jgi:hypothetical protein